MLISNAAGAPGCRIADVRSTQLDSGAHKHTGTIASPGIRAKFHDQSALQFTRAEAAADPIRERGIKQGTFMV